MAIVKLRTVGDDQVTQVDIQSQGMAGILTARVEDKPDEYEVIITKPGSGFVRRRSHITTFRLARTDDRAYVWITGRTYEFEMHRADRRRAGGGHAANEEIVAPMPGTILCINVHPGDSFAPHQPLIIMESMKMEIALSSPASGHVKEILCAVGELVPLGKTLTRLQFEIKK